MQENNNKQESNTFSLKEMNANSRISIPISLARHNMGLAATIIGTLAEMLRIQNRQRCDLVSTMAVTYFKRMFSNEFYR